MLLRAAEIALGLVLVWATLRDLFYTVVVPGSTRGLLKVSRRLVRWTLPLARRGRGRGVDVNFAPIVLGGSFIAWMLMLVLGFALVIHALSDSFEPPLDGFGHALYVAGGSMTTIGFGRAEARGWGAIAAIVAGFCGLASMTLAVTYLLEVQSNIAHRDVGVLKITTTSGQPPCALTLLERFAALESPDLAVDLLREGREWCAVVLQSHVSHPWLVYFRSAGTRSGWPGALGALLDVALIAEMLLDDPRLRAHAVLAREEADRLGQDITGLLSLTPVHAATRQEDAERLAARLVAAGYRMREDRDLAAFVAAREEHTAPIRALVLHLGTGEAPLLPQ
jgi:hypothetical protein